MDAQLHATGEDLYKNAPGLRSAHVYVAHSTLPGGEFNFDFGDVYSGPITRSRKGDDYDRERIDGHFRTNYNILYNLANRYDNPEAQGVANWLKSKGQVNAEEFWTFIWYNPQIKAVPIEQQKTWHYFPDHEVVYWRSSWKDDATAIAFKAGPPEGHAANEKLKLFPDWRLSSGHAHPDAGSFIIWSGGKYLTGDAGYAGVPMTEHHNTVTFGGIGQGREGKGHDAFADVSYDLLNKIGIRDLKADEKGVSLAADLAAAYDPSVGVERFVRQFVFTAPNDFRIEDSIKTSRPTLITSYLHSDHSIVDRSGAFELEAVKPDIFAEILDSALYTTQIGPNFLTAPGPPGNVDKGEREQRGVRLAITTKQPVTEADIKLRLKIRR
jgi:Heparinase II/III-like protein